MPLRERNCLLIWEVHSHSKLEASLLLAFATSLVRVTIRLNQVSQVLTESKTESIVQWIRLIHLPTWIYWQRHRFWGSCPIPVHERCPPSPGVVVRLVDLKGGRVCCKEASNSKCATQSRWTQKMGRKVDAFIFRDLGQDRLVGSSLLQSVWMIFWLKCHSRIYY
eukprot:scaffold15609_cov55-Attheya_sp.AAC.9